MKRQGAEPLSAKLRVGGINFVEAATGQRLTSFVGRGACVRTLDLGPDGCRLTSA